MRLSGPLFCRRASIAWGHRSFVPTSATWNGWASSMASAALRRWNCCRRCAVAGTTTDLDRGGLSAAAAKPSSPAAGPRHPGAWRRRRMAEAMGARTARLQGCSVSSLPLRQRRAVVCHATLGQPNPFGPERWHRIPVHGGHWWCWFRGGRHPDWCCCSGRVADPVCHARLARLNFETIVLGPLLVALLQYRPKRTVAAAGGLVPERCATPRRQSPMPWHCRCANVLAQAGRCWKWTVRAEEFGGLVAVNDMRLTMRR